MLLPTVRFQIIIYFLASLNTVHGLTDEPRWISRMIKHIKKDLKVSQTALIIDYGTDNSTNRIESIIEKVQSKVLSQVIGLAKATFSRVNILQQQKLYQDLQTTTFFIAILFPKNHLQNSSIVDTAEFLIELSVLQIRPKCLMIVFRQKEGLSYKEFLRNMWLKNFLDLTILEVIEKQSGDKHSLWNRRENIAMIHCLNPFTGIYTKKKYKATTKLFPEKLRDLRGTEVKVGSFNYFPYVEVKRNSSGYPTSVSGPEVLVVEALSKAMNFKISEVPAKKDWWGRWNCTNASLSTGFARMLRDNEIRFTTNQGTRSYQCSAEPSRSTGAVRYNALIPKVKQNKRSLLLSMKWFYLVLVIVPIWLIPRMLKFNTYYWSLLHIIQAMLGLTVPREPQKSAQRIVFGTVLIAFLVFSSTLFSALTDIEITEEEELAINTLEDLNKSNLIPTMPELFYNLLKIGSENVTEALLNKSRIGVDREKCIEMLLKHKKIACIDREEIAKMLIPRYLDANGQPTMKIVKETFGHYEKCMLFEKNSPFVGAADKILIKLLETGLNSHWYKPLSSRLLQSEESIVKGEEGSAKLIIPLLIVLVAGYGLSIVAFLIELVK